jgi:hypothetical protein
MEVGREKRREWKSDGLCAARAIRLMNNEGDWTVFDAEKSQEEGKPVKSARHKGVAKNILETDIRVQGQSVGPRP